MIYGIICLLIAFFINLFQLFTFKIPSFFTIFLGGFIGSIIGFILTFNLNFIIFGYTIGSSLTYFMKMFKNIHLSKILQIDLSFLSSNFIIYIFLCFKFFLFL